MASCCPASAARPLLDLGAGAVAGIVESSRDRHTDLGGFAVPTAELAAAFPQVLEANYSFHRSDDRWEAAAEAEKVPSRTAGRKPGPASVATPGRPPGSR